MYSRNTWDKKNQACLSALMLLPHFTSNPEIPKIKSIKLISSCIKQFSKEMYTTSSYSVAGLAWVGTVCSGSNKYSINEHLSVSSTAFVSEKE